MPLRLPGGRLVDIYQEALGGRRALICSSCRFLWCKYSHYAISSYHCNVSECVC